MAVYTTTFYSDTAIGGLKNQLISTPTYVFGSNGVRDDIDANSSTINSQQYHNEVVRKIVFGKKIKSSNLYDMVNRYNWISNVVYSMWDHRTNDIASANFFVLASNRAVYKCLNNNGGSISTQEPTSLSPTPVILSDGYMWKYMYRLTTLQLQTLTTLDYIPIIVDANTTSSAVDGSILTAVVGSRGASYTAVHQGTISLVVNSTVVKIPADSHPISGTFTGSGFYVSSGPGAGQFTAISNYVSNSSGRFIEFSTPLTGLTITSQYEISPYVYFAGDGSGAAGRAIVSNGMISSVLMVTTGSGYTWGRGEVQSNSSYGTGGNITPIIGPTGGHGKDPSNELYSRNLLINMAISGTEASSLPNTFSYGVFGIVNNIRTASNTSVVYSANSFNNTVSLNTVQVGGVLVRGDTIKSDDVNQAEITIINTYSANLVGVYDTRNTAELFDTFLGSRNITGVITQITQPNVYCHDGKLLCYEDINTITHNTNTDTINIILRY